MGYREQAGARARPTAGSASLDDRYRKAAAACCHKGSINKMVRALQSEELASANVGTFKRVNEKLWEANETEAEVAAAVAVNIRRAAADGQALGSILARSSQASNSGTRYSRPGTPGYASHTCIVFSTSRRARRPSVRCHWCSVVAPHGET